MEEAIVLAGGLGTRLRSTVADLPKVMAPVAGQPFLHYIIQKLLRENVKRIIIASGYKHEFIEEFIRNSGYDATFIFSREEEPLGTGGGVQLALRHALNPDIFIINGDSFFDIAMMELMEKHKEHQADITMALKPMEHFERYGTVTLQAEDRIIAFNEKKYCDKGLINGGIYVMKTNLLQQLDLPQKFSLEKDVFESHAHDLKIIGLPFADYFIDIGIPEDFEKAQRDFAIK